MSLRPTKTTLLFSALVALTGLALFAGSASAANAANAGSAQDAPAESPAATTKPADAPVAEPTAEPATKPATEPAADASPEPPAYDPSRFPPAAFEPASWRAKTPEQPKAVLVRGAIVWTNGPQGVIVGGDVLVESGKITAVGKGLAAPAGALIVDGQGQQVTPGLIDAHSHTGISGGVNEGTNIVTAEVRVADVIDPSDIGIYRQLAGGVTTINQLHGSANSIGGQNSVIKLRWGQPADGLVFTEAPKGIKFALGENPKQSNWGVDGVRYPQTRQGVEQSIRERFLAALDYRAAWEKWQKGGGAKGATKDRVPPRRDLQLEAILEILDGKRLVHAHSYRADEIVMLLNVADEFGFRVATLQHVLEGYKVADEIAARGTGASTFSDWWAYKYEVVDAIPWNGAILHDRGVVTSFNSDDDELARRLNFEAAKAVRYGGVPPVEALKFVTLNPAIQLGIDKYVGSLEAGKDADFVVWSGSPLSTYSRVLETWVDGRKYFDRAADLEAREQVAAERQALLAAVRADKNAEKNAKKEAEAEAKDDSSEAEAPEPPGGVDSPPPTPESHHAHASTSTSTSTSVDANGNAQTLEETHR